MKKRCDNNTLTIDLDGRIDTQNAGQIENDLLSAAEEVRDMDLVLDADKLEYISSAGLPCAIAYDTVRCGNQYGIVFELLNAVTVGKVVDQNPDRIPDLGKSMGQLLKQLHTTPMETYLGTTDLASYEQTMQLLSMFYMLLYLAKGKDSKNLTPERAQGMIAQILPRFRQMAPMIRELVKKV